jgi:hypothetical protein
MVRQVANRDSPAAKTFHHGIGNPLTKGNKYEGEVRDNIKTK